MKFTVIEEVLSLGIKIITARITGVKNSQTNTEFENYKKEVTESIRKQREGMIYKNDPILEGFRDLHVKVGRSNRDYVASPERLRGLFLEKGRFPHINTIVDIYNLISLETGLALGAHDSDKIIGNITLQITTGQETFIPLGSSSPQEVFLGEYAYIDDANNILCRLEVLQSEPTKVAENTTDIFLIVEGNAKTEYDYVRKVAEEACELIRKYCGGSYKLLN